MAASQDKGRMFALLVTSAERQMISELLYSVERALHRSQKKAVIPLGEKFSEVTVENVTRLKDKLNTITKPVIEEIIPL